MKYLRKSVLLVFLLSSLQVSFAQKKLLTNFPKGKTPEEIGRLIAYRFLYLNNALHAGKWIGYPQTFYWKGGFNFADQTKDDLLAGYLRNRFELLINKDKVLLPIKNHVDLNMFGCLPLTLYSITKDQRYLDLGLPYADTQWEVPADAKPEEKAWADKGFSWQTRLWIDDMYMITIVQSQAYKATGNRKYIYRAAKEMVLYLKELQRPNGLFYHAPDVPFYWGRGNGWMAAGVTELLRYLPKDNKDRPRILEGYLKMMQSLKNYQQPGGMWNQLIDEPNCWAETSGSAMFAYAFITGVRQGWLPAEEYAPAARKAWLALTDYVDERGGVSEVCVGTNKLNDKQYYYDRPRTKGDFHGQAAYLWVVNALLEK